MAVVGFLNSSSPDIFKKLVAEFRRGLIEAGFIEGSNLTMEYRWAQGGYDRLPVLADELVQRKVNVIFAGGRPAALAAKAATKSIPIVFTSGGDPVELGLVSSLNRPGANLTGVSFLLSELGGKRLALLRELLPAATSFGVLVNPTRQGSDEAAQDIAQAARTLGVRLHVLPATAAGEIDAAMAKFAESHVDALVVASDPFFLIQQKRLIALAARYAIPTMYYLSEYVTAGGLMSYGPSIANVYYLAGAYTAKILKGARPGDLPVTQPTKFDLVINRRTANALALKIPDELLALADKVIE